MNKVGLKYLFYLFNKVYCEISKADNIPKIPKIPNVPNVSNVQNVSSEVECIDLTETAVIVQTHVQKNPQDISKKTTLSNYLKFIYVF